MPVIGAYTYIVWQICIQDAIKNPHIILPTELIEVDRPIFLGILLPPQGVRASYIATDGMRMEKVQFSTLRWGKIIESLIPIMGDNMKWNSEE